MITPDLSELTTLRGAARGLDLRARRPVLASLQGGHRSAQRGRGLEFDEVRLYAAGDDARTIDWRVTARRGRLHTKLFCEERERPVWLIADLHPGMYFGSRRQLKSAVLLRAAALLGWAAALGGDRVGAAIANGLGDPQIFPPRGREAGVLPILGALVGAQPREPGKPGSGLATALMLLRPLAQPGSLVFVLSDFFADKSGFENADVEQRLAGITEHNDCRLLWISDPLERSGLPTGTYRVGLPGRVRWLDGASSQAQWQSAWAQHEQAVEQLATRLRLPLSRLDTHEPVTDRLVSLLRGPAWAA